MLLGASQRQQPSVLGADFSECSDRRQTGSCAVCVDVLWEAPGPAAATTEDLPDRPLNLQGMDSPLDIQFRSSGWSSLVETCRGRPKAVCMTIAWTVSPSKKALQNFLDEGASTRRATCKQRTWRDGELN